MCPRVGGYGNSWDIVKVGYEISFTRYFYQPPPRAPDEIWADIRALDWESEGLLGEIRAGARPRTAKRMG